MGWEHSDRSGILQEYQLQNWEWYNISNTQSPVNETSRDQAIRPLNAQWVEAQVYIRSRIRQLCRTYDYSGLKQPT